MACDRYPFGTRSLGGLGPLTAPFAVNHGIRNMRRTAASQGGPSPYFPLQAAQKHGCRPRDPRLEKVRSDGVTVNGLPSRFACGALCGRMVETGGTLLVTYRVSVCLGGGRFSEIG